VVNGRSEDRGERAVEELREYGVEAYFERADLNDMDAVTWMVDGAIDSVGQIDVLVTSGGAAAGPRPNFFR
jgi:NADP-dependent 3-hydroxy acid dehydrogenase YdfG